MNDLFEDYKKYSKTNRSVYKQDKARLKISANFFDLKRKADSITRKDIDAFKYYLLTQGRSKKTINLYLAIFQKMYNLAIENERVKKNPFKSEVFFKLNPTKMQYLSKDEISTLLDASPDYFSPLIITALNTGLRVGNILNLKWDDINFKLNIIELVENKQDRIGYEGLAEVLSSQVLMCSNIENYVSYKKCFINNEKGCYSENFLKKNETYSSLQRLYDIYYNRELSDVVQGIENIEDRMQYVLEFVKKVTKLDIKEYLGKMLTFDMLILNTDRHFNNWKAILCTVRTASYGNGVRVKDKLSKTV